MLGILLATIQYQYPLVYDKILRYHKQFLLISILIIIGSCSLAHPTSQNYFKFHYLLNGIAFFLIIAAASHHKNLANKFLSLPLFVHLGKYTYGLYIFHSSIIVMFIESNFVQSIVILSIVSFICTYIIAFISYHLFEAHFLKLKQFFR